MKYIRLTAQVSTWTSAVILAVLPIIVAVDFGGVLWWTQYIAAIAILAAAFLAIPTILTQDHAGFLRQHALTLILLCWCAYAWLQTVPVFAGLVSTLSSGSYVAYRDWIKPFMGPEGAATFFPISVAPEQSTHSLAVLTLVLCCVWTATQVFVTRQRIVMLLNVLAVGAALHAAFGIVRQVYPEIHVMGYEMDPHSFGCFVNRNNAALLLNVGLSASLGLLAWRLAALSGLEVDDKNFEVNDLLSLTQDRDSLIGVVSASICIAGLLVCGSRGGLVAMVVGMLLAFGWVRQRRGSLTIPVVAATIIICVVLLLVPLNLSLTSIERFDVFSGEDDSTLLRNGRLPHWQTSLRTAKAHFPAGSGLGSYGYAYLPHQGSESSRWFQHADNLWLEMLVEQGLVGLVLTLSVLFVWIRTLLRMIHSNDPIDHGLRVSGWFMVGALCTSQFFDFGLVIPCNLFAIAVYISANIARANEAGLNASDAESELFASKYTKIYGLALTSAVFLAAIVGSSRLYTDAHVESVALSVKNRLPEASRDEQKLAELAAKIESAPRADSSPRLLELLCKIKHAQARLIETAAIDPGSPEQALSAYASTNIMVRRQQYYANLKAKQKSEDSQKSADGTTDPAEPDDGSADREASDQAADGDSTPYDPTDLGPAGDLYLSVLDHSEKSLRNLPLDMEARTWQLYLDFVHQDPNRSLTAFNQLATIFSGNSEMLMRLGKHAVATGNIEQATRLWNEALVLSPRSAIKVLDAVRQSPGVDLLAVMPKNSTVIRRVTRRLIDSGEDSESLLKRASNEIDCENCETKREKADCHRLAADIAYKLGDFDHSFEQLRQSIELTPTDLKLHLLYISRLRETERFREARITAQRARILFPDDKRFDRIIKAIAAKELEALDETIDPVLIEPTTPSVNDQ